MSIPLTLTGTGTLSNGSASTTNGVASYSTLQVSAAGTGDTLYGKPNADRLEPQRGGDDLGHQQPVQCCKRLDHAQDHLADAGAHYVRDAIDKAQLDATANVRGHVRLYARFRHRTECSHAP